MNDVLGGALGGVLAMVLAGVALRVWWLLEDRRINRVLGTLTHLT